MRYAIVPIILADQPDPGPPFNWPGLYALDMVERESTNRFEAFLQDLEDVGYLEKEVWFPANADFKTSYPSFDLFHQSLTDQWQNTAAQLVKHAKAGSLRDELFFDLELPKRQPQPERFSLEVKHKSAHSPVFSNAVALNSSRLSLIRLYGVQFAPGIVVITGGGIKTTSGSYQLDPLLRQPFDDVKRWAHLMTQARRDPIEISHFVGEAFEMD